jgi:8-oxo-dGTP diphosphatase
MRQIDVAIAVIAREGRVLICQRKSGDTFGDLWEFPGGKREDGESLEQCLARELWEELRIAAPIVRPLTPIVHHYPRASLRLCPFLCGEPDREPTAIESQRFAWVWGGDLGRYDFPPANESLLRETAAVLASTAGAGGSAGARPALAGPAVDAIDLHGRQP